MKLILLGLGMVLVLAAIGLAVWRYFDHRADLAEEARLRSAQPPQPRVFDPAMLDGLPEPAKRYFTAAIRPGTPLRTVATIEMEGRFGLGSRDAPGYMDMTARQVLGYPHGFVWEMTARQGLMRISGSDSGRWTRFWLAGLIPVARAGGTEDHRRSAFGRYAAEAVFWTPAAVLPGQGVAWSALDADRARVTLTHGDLEQSVDVRVNEKGHVVEAVLPRWSNANPEKRWQMQPFSGVLSDHREVEGFTVPFHAEAGNFFGTDDYFPFFIADLTSVSFR